jgi:outer membrane immunogenic protein
MCYHLLFVLGILLSAMLQSYAGDAQKNTNNPSSSAWTGFYAGGFAGYHLGSTRATSPYDADLGYYYNWTGNAYSSNTNGFYGGGALGFNWQSGQLVSGFEGELGYLQLKGSATDPNYQPGTTPIKDTVTRLQSDFYTAAYGRLGIASGPLLLYGKAGAAMIKAAASTMDPCANTAGCGTTTLTMTGKRMMPGWSIGGGIERQFRSRWSVKAEYAYFDFGSLHTAGPGSVGGEYYRQSIGVTAHTLKLGLRYLF